MDHDTPEDATREGRFRTLRTETGLPPESRFDGIDGLLRGGPMQDMEQIMDFMRQKAERRAAEAETAANLPETPVETSPSLTSPPNIIHLPQRAANGEND